VSVRVEREEHVARPVSRVSPGERRSSLVTGSWQDDERQAGVEGDRGEAIGRHDLDAVGRVDAGRPQDRVEAHRRRHSRVRG
jgi:hypothetical protein